MTDRGNINPIRHTPPSAPNPVSRITLSNNNESIEMVYGGATYNGRIERNSQGEIIGVICSGPRNEKILGIATTRLMNELRKVHGDSLFNPRTDVLSHDPTEHSDYITINRNAQ